jgi:hypothetical protein
MKYLGEQQMETKSLDLTYLLPTIAYYRGEDPPWVYVKIQDASRKTIDAWVDYSIQVREEWDEQNTLLLMLDWRESRTVVSPYSVNRSQEILKVRPDLKQRVAILLGRDVLSRILESTVALMRISGTSVFTDEEKAMQWLFEES